MTEILIVIGITLFAVIAFAFELFPIDVVSLFILALLLIFRLVTPQEAVSGFSNPAVITVAAMFILSNALVRTGVVRIIGKKIISMSGGSFLKAFILLLVAASVLSAFINNIAAVAVFLPIAIQISYSFKKSPSKILIPLSYASIFGGTCTLIGTSTNIIISAISDSYGYGEFQVFELFKLGIIYTIIGIFYTYLAGNKLLPSRTSSSSLTGQYHLSHYLTEVRIDSDSPLIGHTPLEREISRKYDINIIEIIRDSQRFTTNIRNTKLAANDLLLIRGSLSDIVRFKEQENLLLLTDIKLDDSDLMDENNILVEGMIAPNSRLTGLTLRQINFRKKYRCFVLAVKRHEEIIRKRVADVAFKFADTLLIFGNKLRIDALREDPDFIILQELEIKISKTRKWWIPTTIIPLVMIVASFGIVSIMEASILGAILIILSKSITIQEAYKAINWTVIFLVATLIPLGIAIENTGTAKLLGDYISNFGYNWGNLAVLSLYFLVTAILTSIMSNNATAIVMAPLAISTAIKLNVDPKPLLMAITYAASLSFMTPIGYKTNAMVYSPGGYKYSDYLKMGTPLTLLFWLIGVILIPVFWNF